MVHFHLSTPYLFIKRCSFNVFCLFHSSEEQSNNDYFIYDCNLVTNHILHYFFLGDDWGWAITSQSLQAASLLDRNYIISRISTFNSVSEHDYLLLFTFLFFFWCDHSNIWKCISKFLLCSTYHYSTRARSYSATSCGWVWVCACLFHLPSKQNSKSWTSMILTLDILLCNALCFHVYIRLSLLERSEAIEGVGMQVLLMQLWRCSVMKGCPVFTREWARRLYRVFLQPLYFSWLRKSLLRPLWCFQIGARKFILIEWNNFSPFKG